MEPLITALKDEDTDVRWYAAGALGKLNDQRAVEPLIAALDDRRLVPSAVGALGSIGDERAVDPIIRLLTDEREDVRLNAAAALGSFGNHRVVLALARALSDSKAGWQVFLLSSLRKSLQKFLRSEANKPLRQRAVLDLIVALRHPSDLLPPMKTVFQAMDEAGVTPLELNDVLKDAERHVIDRVVKVLERIGGPDAERALAEYRARQK